jgi:hypothetical protein
LYQRIHRRTARRASTKLGNALPDALLLQAAEEALDDSVLLRRVRRDELLAEPLVAACRPEAPALEDQPVVGADDRRRAVRPQRAEAIDARLLERTLGFFGAAPAGELVTDDLAIMAVDHHRQVGPAVSPAVDVRHVHRPPFVASRGAAPATPHAWAGCRLTLVDEPTVQREHAVYGFAVDRHAFVETQQGPPPVVAEGRMLPDEPLEARGEDLVDQVPAESASSPPPPSAVPLTGHRPDARRRPA